MIYRNSDQLKHFLLNSSKTMGMSVNNTYNTYFSRRLLELVTRYSYGQIIVKGSFSQYIHLGKLYRPITDIDFASPIDFFDVMDILNFSIDPKNNQSQILFFLNEKPKVTQAGTRIISVICSFGSIKHVIGIDIKCNHKTILETQYKQVKPLFSDDLEFYINTPSYEEHLAEKLCIVAERAEKNNANLANSRLKDFYDIYQLHGGKYDFTKLSIYFEKMLRMRGIISLEDASTEHLNMDFINRNQYLWEIIKNKYGFLDQEVDLSQVVYYSRAVLSEQLQKARCLSNKGNCY